MNLLLGILFLKKIIFHGRIFMNIFNKKQQLVILSILSSFLAQAGQNNNLCPSCPFFDQFTKVHQAVFAEFERMNEHIQQTIKDHAESMPVGCEISQDDNFVYIKLKSEHLNDAKIESSRQGNAIILNVDSAVIKINATISEYKTQLAVEKNEEKEGKQLLSKYKQVCSLPAAVDLKNVEIKKFKSENSLMIKLEKNELEKIYRIQVTEE